MSFFYAGLGYKRSGVSTRAPSGPVLVTSDTFGSGWTADYTYTGPSAGDWWALQPDGSRETVTADANGIHDGDGAVCTIAYVQRGLDNDFSGAAVGDIDGAGSAPDGWGIYEEQDFTFEVDSKSSSNAAMNDYPSVTYGISRTGATGSPSYVVYFGATYGMLSGEKVTYGFLTKFDAGYSNVSFYWVGPNVFDEPREYLTHASTALEEHELTYTLTGDDAAMRFGMFGRHLAGNSDVTVSFAQLYCCDGAPAAPVAIGLAGGSALTVVETLVTNDNILWPAAAGSGIVTFMLGKGWNDANARIIEAVTVGSETTSRMSLHVGATDATTTVTLSIVWDTGQEHTVTTTGSATKGAVQTVTYEWNSATGDLSVKLNSDAADTASVTPWTPTSATLNELHVGDGYGGSQHIDMRFDAIDHYNAAGGV